MQTFMALFPSVPIMTFETGRRNLLKIKIALSEHTGQCLLGCLLQLLICTGIASGLILWWVCCQDQPFKACVHFCFLHMTYHKAKNEWIGAETIAQRRRRWDDCQKPRKGVGMTRGEVRGRVLLDGGKVSVWSPGKGQQHPKGPQPGSLKERWSLAWVQIPALQVLSLKISHFTLWTCFFWNHNVYLAWLWEWSDFAIDVGKPYTCLHVCLANI